MRFNVQPNTPSASGDVTAEEAIELLGPQAMHLPFYRDAIAALIKKQQAELKLWKPMTMEEARAALAEAEEFPVSDEEIAAIVAKVTDPTYRPTEPEHVQMAAKIEQQQARIAALESQGEREILEAELEVGAEYLGELSYTDMHATAVWNPTDTPGDHPWSGANGCFDKDEFRPLRKLTPPAEREAKAQTDAEQER